MIKSLIKNILLFFFIVLIQVLIFNNIELGGFLNPYIYVLFILLLPFNTPRWLLLITAFALGLSVDIFSETLGMHTAATVFMAYLRPAVLTMFSPREGYEAGQLPRIHYFGVQWFVQYTLVLVFAHHSLLFLTELFRFHDIFSVLLRIILSTLFSASIICLSQFFVFKK
jgi:rod shape-determining protein MreD